MQKQNKIMQKQLVAINPQEFGLKKTEAQKIEAVFTPMLQKMVELEKDYNAIIKLPINTNSIQKARELRLKYVKVRTGTDEIHKKAKAYYLAGGRFVDAWRNAQKFSAIGKEAELQKIEKHFELIEEAKKEKINAERIAKLQPYVEDVKMYNLKEMSDKGFNNLLNSSKIAFEAQQEAEKKAEQERIAQEKAERAEQERIKKENIRLKAEIQEKEAAREKERIAKEKIQAEIAQKQAEIDRKEKEQKQLKKKKEFAEFLAKNGYTTKNKENFIIKEREGKYLLFKKIAEF